MRINLTLVLDEDQVRRVRALTGRGGKATRAEVRIWLQRVALDALAHAPEPKRRRAAAAVTTAPAPTPPASLPGVDDDDAPETPAPVTDETKCRHCKRRRENHGKMSGTCPPGFGARIGSRFEPAEGR